MENIGREADLQTKKKKKLSFKDAYRVNCKNYVKLRGIRSSFNRCLLWNIVTSS